jgi:hypothetical protein
MAHCLESVILMVIRSVMLMELYWGDSMAASLGRWLVFGSGIVTVHR